VVSFLFSFGVTRGHEKRKPVLSPERWFADTILFIAIAPVSVSQTHGVRVNSALDCAYEAFIIERGCTVKLTLKHYVGAILPPPCFSLSHNNSWHYFLPQLRFPFFHRNQDHIADACSREPVQATAHTVHRDDVQVLRTGVVGTVYYCANWKTKRTAKLGACCTTTPAFTHDSS